ncbi:MAG: SGNH/GDSL hydrolase family protein [Runella sp.]
MNKILRYLRLTFFTLPFVAAHQDKPQRIIFLGDSITQAGIKPGGYIVKMTEMLQKQGLSAKYTLLGAGISGNKVYDLYLRLEDDVLAQQPDVVVIYVGVNDVWHKTTHGTGTDPDKFVKFYEAIIRKLKSANIKPVLCTPAAIGEKTDFSNAQDGDLNHYSQLIRDLAKRHTLPLIDLRKAFLEYNLQNNPQNLEKGILTTDRVHLNDTGNQLVADKMWEILKIL